MKKLLLVVCLSVGFSGVGFASMFSQVNEREIQLLTKRRNEFQWELHQKMRRRAEFQNPLEALEGLIALVNPADSQIEIELKSSDVVPAKSRIIGLSPTLHHLSVLFKDCNEHEDGKGMFTVLALFNYKK